jgi:hypothetical protein
MPGQNAGGTILTVSPEGMAAEPGSVDGLPVVYELDPGSFVLTAFGRANAGTFHEGRDLSDRFLRLFLRSDMADAQIDLEATPKRFRQVERSSPPIPLTCFAYLPPDLKIRCATHLVHRRNVPPGGDH